MKCWNCGKESPDPSFGKLSFRETCELCHAALHCCFNCIYYKPGLANDCKIPGTESIGDRAAANFCEEFKLSGKGPVKGEDPKKVAKRLFGDEEEEVPKRKFDSLFGD